MLRHVLGRASLTLLDASPSCRAVAPAWQTVSLLVCREVAVPNVIAGMKGPEVWLSHWSSLLRPSAVWNVGCAG